jgi:hypothetical protein
MRRNLFKGFKHNGHIDDRFDSTLAIFREKEKEREGAYLPQECSHPQI